jgi:anti-anti-sigma factor
MFSTTIETQGRIAVCRIHGEADSASASALRETMGALSAYRSVVLDFSGVSFIDSAGLGTVIGGTRRIRESGGDIVLCSARKSIDRLLHTVGMDRILEMYESLPEALAALQDRAASPAALA